MKTSSFWAGYGNLYAPYEFTAKWLKRAELLAELVHKMGVSEFLALEGHGDTTAAGGDGKAQLARLSSGKYAPIYSPFLDALPTSWTVAEGEGGNHRFYDANKSEVVKTRDQLMPGKRWMTGWKVRRLATSAEYWTNAAHLTAGSTTPLVRNREAQGRFLASKIVASNPVIVGIDANNATRYAGSPRAVLEAGGLRGLREKSSTPVVNGNRPSHHGGGGAQWIDDMLTSSSVKVDHAELVPTGTLSDHEFLKARFTIPVTIR